jgi:hypothetical protein
MLSEHDILTDLKSALDFNPRLKEFIVATTAPRDEALQEFARRMTESNLRKGLFSVAVSFWDDIRDELSREENLDLVYRFFEGAMINYENLGIAVAKLVRLHLGVAGRIDCAYELLLGRTPAPSARNAGQQPSGSWTRRSTKDSYPDIKAVHMQSFGLNYWRGNHFIANLNDRTMDTFPIPTFASDLERVFKSKRDAYIVAKWLSAREEGFADLLYGEENEYGFLISWDEFKEFAAISNEGPEDDSTA